MDEFDENQDRDQSDEPKTNQLVRRGFDGVTMAHENAATQALIAKATAVIQARWIVAMKCPRSMHDVRQRLLAECKRPQFAKVAMYAVPRGGTMIRGLSIRFAEAAMKAMGNMSCEADTLFDSPEERVIRVTATDYESNTSWQRDITVKKTVERRKLGKGQRPITTRENSFGDRIFIVEATDDDVLMKESQLISKASRTAILRVIPGGILDEMKAVIGKVVEDETAKDPNAERNMLFDAFAQQNVMPTDIEAWLGHPIDRTTPAELVDLRLLFAALRDGEMSWEEALEQKQVIRGRADKARAEQAKRPTGQAPGGPPAASPPPNTAPNAAPAAATPAPAPAPATKPAAAATAPADERKSSGRGTAAAKDKLAKPAGAAPAGAPPQPELSMPPKDPGHVASSETKIMDCSMCGGPFEAPADAPPNMVCDACGNS